VRLKFRGFDLEEVELANDSDFFVVNLGCDDFDGGHTSHEQLLSLFGQRALIGERHSVTFDKLVPETTSTIIC
jgi:hypothetical protein